jgi:nucleotide-binding universal stress UspA family protein
LNVRHDLLEGRAAESIITYAHNQDADLILMSSHGQSGLSPWNVSSTVQQVILRFAICDDRAGLPTGDRGYRRFSLPAHPAAFRWLITQHRCYLRRIHTRSAEIIIAMSCQPEIVRRTPFSRRFDLVSQITDRNRRDVQVSHELKSRLDVSVDTRSMISDKVAGSLHSLVEDEGIDLVIMSAHGYSGDPRWPYGSTVVSFIVYGTTPLLVLQDLPENRIQPTRAEEVVREYGGLKAVGANATDKDAN